MTGDPWPLPGWTWTDAFGWQPPSDSVYTTYGAQMTKEPSEAAMQEARRIVSDYVDSMQSHNHFIDKIARALDRHTAAQREKDAKTLEDLASAGAKLLRPNATLLEAAAAIRSAP